ncbi:ribonuclease domain-containing protein [Denitromonas ohlonensis]|jgi:guanyl-specific ribonuclease Sa|uniref:Ribonuclease n=2 Tax=Denitromonas TaxID=139331 RepID=A0A558EJF3_9RHOO|nr:ribonuclease domain-containing protein [Denitromonas ohlonensis]TVT49034.1 MAG: ribonuclease [Denitromonas halophila]TVO62860.1 ribonuclease [Denitromonas ohlonensis]TVO75023.1 ribonuclease [Denitromonas ohlonensis]TVT73410.1 MAG: ribonuclease [Denitromonas halophila]TVT75984.1 MAG: ribonuclease [Denitromonas halophila]
MRRLTQTFVVFLLAAFALLPACSRDAPPGTASAPSELAWLPPEALSTLDLIQRGGPFPYSKDGTTFFNREGLLPRQSRSYYREYTVPTPGERTRGARRIVAGGNPPEVFYYTADHYRSFRRIPETR